MSFSLSIAAQRPESCPFDVVHIKNNNGYVDVSLLVYSSVKYPSVTLLNCNNEKSSLPLPRSLEPGQYTYPIKREKCNCKDKIEYIIKARSPYCQSKKTINKNYCIDEIIPDTVFVEKPVYKDKVVYKDKIEYKDRIIEKKDPCDICTAPWNCFGECFICWLLGLLVGLYLLFRILFIGEDKIWDFWIFGQVSKPNVWEAIFGSIAISVVASCPCQSAFFGVAGSLIGSTIIAWDLFRKEKKYPEWKSGLLVTIGLLLSFVSILLVACN
jgi:hypothetical protein